MPRDIPVGNGKLLINFDASYQIRDIYFPHVGKENQSAGHPFRFGVWCDGMFSWVHAANWEKSLRYVEETLVTHVTLYNASLKLRLVCNDAVDFHEDVFIRRIRVQNLTDQGREVRLFFSHDFHIYETEIGDTAYYYPTDRAIVHYKARRYFFMNCATGQKTGWDQYACGKKELGWHEGTWRDCEDGNLSYNAIEQGPVDSSGAVHVIVPPQGETTVMYWMAAGTDYKTVKTVDEVILSKSPDELLNRTTNFWRLWVNKEDFDFHDLPERVIKLFKTSLLVIRTQTDVDGALIAANDSDIAYGGGDTYSYMWTRDGSLVSHALSVIGDRTLSARFYFFCNELLTDEGYFLHNYNADGTPGSNWHSWVAPDRRWLPIQEDETALVLWALWEYYDLFRDVEIVRKLYRSLITHAADFLCSYRYDSINLPLPSFDLWEERRGIHAWTVASVYGGLQAAANFSAAFGEMDRAERYRSVCKEIKDATDLHMWREDLNRFARTIHVQADGSVTADTTIDSANIGLWYFGMYDPDDPRIAATMKSIEEHLWVKTSVGGVARYQNDYYHQRRSDIQNVPGNPWFICTLWLAEWYIAKAKTKEEMEPALKLIDWVVSRALPSGVLAEQVHPDTGEPLSVSPLTWSHATFVLTVMEYLDEVSQLELCDKCHTPVYLKEGFRIRHMKRETV